MKTVKLLAVSLVLVPSFAFSDGTAPSKTDVESPERCITATSGVRETSKQLKELSAEMGWDLGTMKAMSVAGVVKGKTMSSKAQVDVCLKSSDTVLNYQVRTATETADDLAWEELTDDKV